MSHMSGPAVHPPSIVIPVEIQSREMTAKLYLGAVAASRGFTAIVGDQKEVSRNLHRFRPGIYVDKSIARTKRGSFARLRRLGFIPVALCEEGLVYRNAQRYVSERIDLTSLGLVETFFCWGQQQKDDVSAAVGSADKLSIVGNPRFDLLRPEFRDLWAADAHRLAGSHGRYILVNTNFSRANKLGGTQDVIQLLEKRGTLDPAGGAEYYRGLVAHLGTLHAAFLDIIPRLAAAFPSHLIVVRPHPGENRAPYDRLAQDCANVRVDNTGSVIPWILASEAVIHNSCTTGVEARILSKPTLSFVPVQDDRFDSYLPNQISHKCETPEALIRSVERVTAGKEATPPDAHADALLDHYVSALRGELSADMLITQLASAGPGRASVLERVKETVTSTARRTLRKFPGLGPSKGLKALATQKFPGVSLVEAEQTLDALATCRADLKNLRIRKMHGWKNVFMISAREG